MKRIQHLLKPAGLVIAVLGILVGLGFVERTTDRMTVQHLEVHVKDAEGLHFIDANAVRREVMDQGVEEGQGTIGALDLASVEERLRNLPSVARAEVYHTLDGSVHVSVEQRVPIARVFNRDGSSFYIDEQGYAMPTSERFTARVPVFTGYLQEPGASDGVMPVIGNDSLMALHRSDEIYHLARFLRKEPFWNAMVDQVVVTRDGEFELVPKVGAQRILLGDGSELEQRFAKLQLFYVRGIPQSDWRRYAHIDLRFADQIVCTKRPTP